MIKKLHKKHTLLIKKSLKCLNTYSSIQNIPLKIDDYGFSLVDLQIMSALYPNKENQYNMVTISNELGIASSTFSKSVSKLTNLGLMEKYRKKNNKKNVIVCLSSKGEKYYTEIFQLYENSLNHLISSLDDDPLREKYYIEFLETLESYLIYQNDDKKSDDELIPVITN